LDISKKAIYISQKGRIGRTIMWCGGRTHDIIALGSIVVKALCYKLESHVFKSRVNTFFQFTYSSSGQS
jgi:hypothetical protein